MQPGIQQHDPDAPAAAGHVDRVRRVGILRKLAKLVIGTAMLIVCVLIVRDARQVTRANEWARRYVDSLKTRPMVDGLLPLNLEPPAEAPGQVAVADTVWLDRDQARLLRGHTGPVIVARTSPINLALREDGRMTIVFEGGQWRTEWLPLRLFDERMKAQDGLIGMSSEPGGS